MARGKFITCLSIGVLLVFSVALLVFAADPPEKITLKPALWPTPTKTPVEFTHKKHSEEYKVACDQCHHVYQDGKNTWKQGDAVKKCEECHTEATIQGEKKLPPDQQKLNLKLAFHNDCQGCHQKLKKENAESKAPVICAGCHPGAKTE